MTYILPKPPLALSLPFLIVCEGFGDAQFFDRLLEFHEIANSSIGCPSRDVCGEQEGENDLQRYLGAIKFLYRKKNPSTLRGLLLVVDADESAANQFAHATEALHFAEFPYPKQPFAIEENEEMNLRTAVFLVPGENRTGTLENILLEAATLQRPELTDCLEQFSECTGVINTATPNQQAKMKMSVLVGGLCKDNPWASVALMWKDRGNPVPINSPVLKPIVDYLRLFTT